MPLAFSSFAENYSTPLSVLYTFVNINVKYRLHYFRNFAMYELHFTVDYPENLTRLPG